MITQASEDPGELHKEVTIGAMLYGVRPHAKGHGHVAGPPRGKGGQPSETQLHCARYTCQ